MISLKRLFYSFLDQSRNQYSVFECQRQKNDLNQLDEIIIVLSYHGDRSC